METYRDIITGATGQVHNRFAYGKLISDIDLQGSASDPWSPIGSSGNNKSPFDGVFDGNGHTISGLYINTTDQNQGLFGSAGSYGQSPIIKNLTVIGNVAGGENTGGIVGNGQGQIINCHFSGTVSGSANVGGIVGYFAATEIRDCSNAGAVTATVNLAGGIAGALQGSATTVTNCYNTGTITTNNEGHSMAQVGGVVGAAYVDTVFNSCYNSGTITANGSGVGGLVGSADTSQIINCYNSGAVSSTNDYVGGLVGDMWAIETPGSITNCYNIGMISSTYASPSNVGSVAGRTNGTTTNCFYLTDTSNNGIGYTTSGATATSFSAAELAVQSTFPTAWFASDGAWYMGASAPLLKAFQTALIATAMKGNTIGTETEPLTLQNGDSFTVTIDLKCSSNIEGAEFILQYDKDYFSPTAIAYPENYSNHISNPFNSSDGTVSVKLLNSTGTLSSGTSLAVITFNVIQGVTEETSKSFSLSDSKVSDNLLSNALTVSTTDANVKLCAVLYNATLSVGNGVVLKYGSNNTVDASTSPALLSNGVVAGVDYIVTIQDCDFANYDYTVIATVSGESISLSPVAVSSSTQATITVPKESVTGDISISVSRALANYTVSTSEYIAGYNLVMIKPTEANTSLPVYNYDSKDMYYIKRDSEQYFAILLGEQEAYDVSKP